MDAVLYYNLPVYGLLLMLVMLTPCLVYADICLNTFSASISCFCYTDSNGHHLARCNILENIQNISHFYWPHRYNTRVDRMEFWGGTITDLNAYGTYIPDMRIVRLSFKKVVILNLKGIPLAAELEYLEFSENKLKYMPGSIFTGLSKLQVLNITANDIHILPDIFGYRPAFPAEMYFTNCNITTTSLTAFPPHLEILNLDGNNISRIYNNSFSNIATMTTLSISGNKLFHINRMAFQNFTMCLKTLNLSHNKLSTISGNLLNKMVVLKTLYLNDNCMTNLSFDAFSDLKDLEKLYLENNTLQLLDDRLFISLTKLTHLFLQNNRLKMLPASIFVHAKDLIELNISGNKISVLSCTTFQSQHTLITLNLAHNQLSTICPALFSGLHQLRFVTLDHNHITFSVSDNFLYKDSINLLGIYFSSNNLTILPANIFTGVTSVQDFYLDNNNIEDIDDGAFSGIDNIYGLHLNNNSIQHVPRHWLSDLSVYYLDISHNNISTIDDFAFMSDHLVSLRIKGNLITTLSRNIFYGAPNLTILDISDNLIEYIEPGCFARSHYFEWLWLSGNKIKHISKGVFKGRIDRLALDKNLIEWIEPGSFKQISYTSIVDLSYNTLDQIEPSQIEFGGRASVDLRWNNIRCLSQNLSELYSISTDHPDAHSVNCSAHLCLQHNTLQCDCSLLWLRRHSEIQECLTCYRDLLLPKCSNKEGDIFNFISHAKCSQTLENTHCVSPSQIAIGQAPSSAIG